MESILLVGAGGHAKACIDVIEREGSYSIKGLIGSASEVGKSALGYKVIGTDDDLPGLVGGCKNALVGVGQIKSPNLRMKLFDRLVKLGFNLPTIISPLAYVASSAVVEIGTVVMHGAIVNSDAKVGKNCIINSKALIEHDVCVGDHCHVSTGAILNGTVCVDDGVFIGSGAVVREGVRIGKDSLIGMGQAVLTDCEDNCRLTQQKGRG